MEIKFSRGIIRTHHGDVGQAILEQPKQWVLHGKCNLCPSSGGQEDITGKMYGIAKTLFPINKKPLVLERFLAQP